MKHHTVLHNDAQKLCQQNNLKEMLQTHTIHVCQMPLYQHKK